MGALCSKKSSDPFDQPGRTLDTAPPPTSGTASLPADKKRINSLTNGPGRTLGGPSTAANEDARQKAAQAALARTEGRPQPKGKLGQDLNKQKRKTQTDTLRQAREERLQERKSDQGDLRTWN
ncbi:MAG: hypothetical protein M1825_004279 [Sarcosagium campestre]|nr:MAG: hypothetical protein M1825_004279 [Sarcosagium campestre]